MPFPAALSPERQQEAARLYRSGLSARQVSEKLGVSLDATFYALRRQKVPRRSIVESNRLRFEAKPLSYTLKQKLTEGEERLKLAAILLYWAEGYKVGNHSVDFANSDVEMAQIFRRFLSEVCQVDESRIRAALYCYEGQDIAACTRFWSRALHIPERQFTKPYIKKAAAPGPRGPRMTHGLVHIRYCDKKLLRQVLEWIDEYRQELTK
ncbi:MAG TPA: hypothetical protein VF829_03330 [Candidatus Paceibacterota bacterium]